MDKSTASKWMWRQALTGGLIIGLVLFVWDFICYKADLQGFISTPIQLLILIGGILYFGNKLRTLRGPELGFPYGTCFGFVIALMLCTGLVYGIGQYFLQMVIAPEHFAEAFEVALQNSGVDDSVMDQALGMYGMMKNPLVMIFGGIFSMIFLGGFLGLILSAFLQKKPDPFAESDPNA